MNLTKEELKQKIKELEPWRHDIDLGDGVRTGTGKIPALQPFRKWALVGKYLPEDMSGSTVLDLGCNTGYLAIQCKLRGAEQVVAVDNFEKNIKQAKFLSEYFDAPLEIIRQDAHIFSLLSGEHFDYIILSRVLYHLKYPNLVIDRIAEMTKKRLIVITEIIGTEEILLPQEDYTNEEYDKLEHVNYPKMVFIEKKLAGDESNWWLMNTSGCASLIRSAGLKIIDHPRRGTFVCEPAKKLSKIRVNTEFLNFPST